MAAMSGAVAAIAPAVVTEVKSKVCKVAEKPTRSCHTMFPIPLQRLPSKKTSDEKSASVHSYSLQILGLLNERYAPRGDRVRLAN
jgi:hypothetical protein